MCMCPERRAWKYSCKKSLEYCRRVNCSMKTHTHVLINMCAECKNERPYPSVSDFTLRGALFLRVATLDCKKKTNLRVMWIIHLRAAMESEQVAPRKQLERCHVWRCFLVFLPHEIIYAIKMCVCVLWEQSTHTKWNNWMVLLPYDQLCHQVAPIKACVCINWGRRVHLVLITTHLSLMAKLIRILLKKVIAGGRFSHSWAKANMQ